MACFCLVCFKTLKHMAHRFMGSRNIDTFTKKTDNLRLQNVGNCCKQLFIGSISKVVVIKTAGVQ